MSSHDRNDLKTSERPLGVAEAKRRFSELIDRVDAGERFVVSRRGRPAIVLVRPTSQTLRRTTSRPTGLAAAAGSLADWENLDEAVEEIYAARGRSRDRPAPDLD
jgi:antitoxin (DNA-binding transcriptional repressor) of toxin-antitoxin stability system